MVSEVRHDGVSLLDGAVFLGELVLLAVLGIAGWRLGGSQPWQTVLAVAMPLALACGWGLWLAPNAVMRLRFPIRMIVKIDVFVAGAVLLALSGLIVWGVVFGVVTVGLVVLGELTDHRRERDYASRG